MTTYREIYNMLLDKRIELYVMIEEAEERGSLIWADQLSEIDENLDEVIDFIRDIAKIVEPKEDDDEDC